jgi:apolipoprotein N-acyltransferase
VLFWLDDARNVRRRVLPGISTPVLFGGIRHGERVGDHEREHNTAFLADENGDVVGTYDKTYLLAFGEYLPFGDTFPVLYDISPMSGRFSAGDDVTPLELEAGGETYRLSILICYEDIVSRFVRRAVDEGDPHLLVNMTVDSWFGETQEPDVHLGLARFRAIEHRRWLVRATNSGVTAFVDPTGAVVSRTGLFTAETLAGDVAMMSGTRSPFLLLGHWPAYLALAAIAWMAQKKRPERLPR